MKLTSVSTSIAGSFSPLPPSRPRPPLRAPYRHSPSNTTTRFPYNRWFSFSTSFRRLILPRPIPIIVHHRPPSRRRAVAPSCPPYRPVTFASPATTETLTPELELIDSRIVQPCKELNDICKKIRKSCTKRDHKLIDFDRHNNSLNKLREKKEKSLKDEKNLFTVSRRWFW